MASPMTPGPASWCRARSAGSPPSVRPGVVNLAPYSFFNIISTRPPFVMFSSSTRKHSQRNAELSGEFVFNLATYDLRDRDEHHRQRPSRGGERGRSRRPRDGAVAGGETAAGRSARRSRSNASTAGPSTSCRSNGKKTVNSLVIGEVVNVHIDDAVIVDGNIDMARIRPHRPPRLHGLHLGGQYLHHAPGAGALEHDPEKWVPVFREDHAQTKS